MKRGILATNSELASLRDRIARKPFDAIYANLQKRCSLILQTTPVTESRWQSFWQNGAWGSALNAARATQGRIIDLLIAHNIDPNAAYRDRAIEELKNLIGWSTWVDPCHAPLAVDLCTASAGVGAVVGLDWLWDDLTEPDRLRVLHALRHKVIDPYRKALAERVWWYDCYHNWNAVVNSGCGIVAMALSDELPAAAEAYHLARAGLKHFLDSLGREGGWNEGIGYWGYAMRYLLLMGEASDRLMDDQSIFHARGMDATGLFGVYFTPNAQAASFGDAAHVPLSGAFYLLVKHYGLKAVTWWLDAYAFNRDVSSTDISAAGLALLFRPIDADVVADPDLAPVKVFNEIGWAAMADRWPRPTFYVAAKTGDLSANHSHHDMNSIQLQVDGEMLLTDPGAPPYNREYFSSDRGTFYEVQARAHNTIVVADRDHFIDAQGGIIEAQAGKDFRWLAADAGSACGENSHFIRHVVMLLRPSSQGGAMLAVLDEIHNPVAETINVLWHTHGDIELNPNAAGGRIAGKLAALHMAFASTVKFALDSESRELSSSRRDNVLRLAASTSKAMFASVFSRAPLKDAPQFKNAAGLVKLKVGKLEMHFKRLKRHLQFAAVQGVS